MPSSITGLEAIRSEIQELEAAPAVKTNVRAHYKHLEALAANLRAIGMDDSVIEEHVVALFERYKAELDKIITNL